MTLTTEPDSAPEPQFLFRAGKKRKNYRHRAEQTETETAQGPLAAPATDNKPTISSTAATSDEAGAPTATNTSLGDAPQAGPAVKTGKAESEDEGDEGVSVAQALKLRNARKARLGGVAFRAESERSEDIGGDAADDGKDEALQKAEAIIIGGITNRFAPQTGIVGEVETELARRKRSAAAAQQQQEEQQQGIASDGNASFALAARPDLAPTMSVGKAIVQTPATRGRIMEIDLGDEARARNEVTTERAMRRMQGDEIVEEDDESGRPRKVRLGRDGKPWRPRNRRGSDDVKRDQLVDEFMRENKLDVYDLQEQQAVDIEGEEDDEEGAADDRLAEQFRRDFMENLSQRRRRRKAPAPTSKSAPKAPTEEILRGPKLGGSRNVRQQMRDLLLKEQVEKKKR